MVAKMRTLYDDFELPGVDRSKWTDSGTNIAFPNTTSYPGIRLTATTSYSSITSTAAYDMASTSTAAQYAMIRVETLPLNTTSESNFWILRSGTIERYLMQAIYSSGWKLVCRYRSAAGVTTTLATIAFASVSSTGVVTGAMKYWRMIHQLSTNKILYQTSADGSSWTTRATSAVTFTAGSGYTTTLECGTSAGTSGYFTVRRFNTMKQINRGTGFVTDTFDSYPLMTVPNSATSPPTQFGVWYKQYAGGGVQILQDPISDSVTAHTLYLDTATGDSAEIRSKLRTKIKDVDITATVGVDYLYDVDGNFKLTWRVSSDGDTYYYLRITDVDIKLGVSVGGTLTTLFTYTISADLSRYYTYRVVNVGSSFVVFRDSGLGSADFGRPTTELFRTSDPTLTAAGDVGFSPFSSTAFIDNYVAKQGVLPPITSLAKPFYRRDIGAYVERGGRKDAAQTNWTDDTTVITDFEESIGRTLDYVVDFHGSTANLVPNPYFDNNATGWNNDSNVTVARSTSQARSGTASLAMTSVAGGTMGTSSDYYASGTAIPVTVGTSYTANVWFRAAVSARSVRVDLSWRNSSGVSVSTSTGSTVTDTTSGWTKATITATAPATAAYVYVKPTVVSTGGASEVHYIDDVLFRKTDLTAISDTWPTAAYATMASGGRGLLLFWETYGIDFGDILLGDYDTLISDLITKCKAVPGTVYFAPFHEFNLKEMVWSAYYDSSVYGTKYDNNVASFAQWKLVWQYIYNKFVAASATNVEFVWVANEGDVSAGVNLVESYYPGDAYVDVMGIDGFNWGLDTGENAWRSHSSIFTGMYNRLAAISDKPIWFSSTGSVDPEYRTADFETGVEGDAVTTIGTWYEALRDTTGVDTFDGVTGTVTTSFDAAYDSLMGMKSVLTAGTASYAKWNTAPKDFGSSTNEPWANVSALVKCPTWAPNNGAASLYVDLISGYKAGVRQWAISAFTVFGVTTNETPELVLRDSTGTQVSLHGNLSPTATNDQYLPDGEWRRIEVQVYQSTTAGQIVLRVYRAGETTPLLTVTSDANNNIDVADEIRFGQQTNYAVTQTVYFDDIKYSPDTMIESYSKSDWLEDFLTDRQFPQAEAVVFFSREQYMLASSDEVVETVQGLLTESEGFNPEEPQIKPEGWSANAQASPWEYAYLEDDFGNKVNILPSYGDIFLVDAEIGGPDARTVLEDRPLGDGSRSYTRFHGSAAVTMRLKVRKTTTGSTNNYVDLLQGWSVPGRSCRLVYKPRGANERAITLMGTPFSRSVERTGAIRQYVDMSFIAPDGGAYETTEKSLTLEPGDSRDAVSYGSLRTEPIIRIYGPVTNPVIYNDSIEYMYQGRLARLGLTVDLLDGEFIELDCKERTVRYGGFTDDAANRRNLLTTRDWFVLDGITNALRFESEESPSSGRCVITWKDKY